MNLDRDDIAAHALAWIAKQDAKSAAHPLAEVPASFPQELRWYAIHTGIRAEQKAGQEIEKLGFPAFIPVEKHIRRRRRGKPLEIEQALFPRYGFVQFDINDDRWAQIVDLDEVIDVCRGASIPIAVPESFIEQLRLAIAVGAFDHTQPPKVGLSVEVMEGPFSGFIGKIVRSRSGDRVDVLLDMLNRKSEVNIPLRALREA